MVAVHWGKEEAQMEPLYVTKCGQEMMRQKDTRNKSWLQAWRRCLNSVTGFSRTIMWCIKAKTPESKIAGLLCQFVAM